MYIYTKVSVRAGRVRARFLGFGASRFLVAQNVQNRPERGQSRSEPLRIAQSAPRTAPDRPERAQSRSAPLRIAQSAPRTTQNRPERAEQSHRIAQSASRAAKNRSE